MKVVCRQFSTLTVTCGGEEWMDVLDVWTSGKEAVEIYYVIQIPLTFHVACLLAFFEKGNHEK